MKTMLAILAVVLTAACAWAEEQSVKITTLTLTDNKIVKCIRVSMMKADDVTLYSIVDVDGKKAQYKGDDVKSETSEMVVLSTLPDAAQRALSKTAPAAPAKPADTPAEKSVPADASADVKLAAVRTNGAIADERKKLDAAIQAIMDEGQKAVAIQGPLDDAAKKIDAQVAALDAEADQIQRAENNPQLSKANRAAYDTKLNAIATRKAGMMQQKNDADKAAADQDAKVADLVATKDKKIADLKAAFEAKCTEIKAKFAVKDSNSKDSKDASTPAKDASDPAAKDAKK